MRQRDTSLAHPHNRLDTDDMSGPKGSPRGPGESVKPATVNTSVPMDKLDASQEVNGPEDDVFDWLSIDWKSVEGEARRIRQRIFTASREGDLKKVRNLQKLMLRSRSNALVAVRRVAEVNAGRKTPGVDGRTALASKTRAELALWVQTHARTWNPRAVKRVYIPKSNGKKRPLGIPVIRDRALQALVLNALEPEWEARFEPRSYGFRPGRGCHDAIEAIFNVTRGKLSKRVWVLDADLAAAFDHIDHQRLLSSLGTFPARDLIQAWLKAGIVENGQYAPTVDGTPQGGVISPLLLNIALHGMEEAAGVRYRTDGVHAGKTALDSPVLIRYADDFVALCHSAEQAGEVKARLVEWLAPKGLAFNEEKTRICHLDEGFAFLGFNVRRYKGNKLLIKPSPEAVARFRNRLRDELRTLRGTNASDVIKKLNPILRGWAAYYRVGVSKRTFSALDDYLWWAVYRWACWTHPNKPKKWITKRYFGTFSDSRKARWVFGDPVNGVHLTKLAWTPIVRHVMVQGDASLDDPSLAEYWAQRRRRRKPPLSEARLGMLQRQRGRCPLCGDFLLETEIEPQHPDDWTKWFTGLHRAIKYQAVTTLYEKAKADDRRTSHRLVHVHCVNRTTHRLITHLSALPSPRPAGLA
ncbi:group II intron reverse transcriptase/maturase [Streptomyces californicus]|uniref:group II intron reverse transcriptase/maturase n=1 Tax=Streptomyces californicus TaxID=67351 RepID=UPI0037B801D7